MFTLQIISGVVDIIYLDMHLPGAGHLQRRAGPVEAVLVRVLGHVVVGAQPHLHIALHSARAVLHRYSHVEEEKKLIGYHNSLGKYYMYTFDCW